jgi:predicted RNase H-like HicB family nuclease
MTDHRYEVTIYWSEPDQAYIAEVPELAGCAADGATAHQALEAVNVAISEWIDTARELGRAIPEPKSRAQFA